MREAAAMSRAEAVRREIITAAGGSDSELAFLFEPRPARDGDAAPAYHAPSSALGAESAFSFQSLLPRWLRVNNTVLEVPDRFGVFEALDEHDRQLLQSLHVAACVPLVIEGELVAWIGLVNRADPRTAYARASAMMPRAAHWAGQLRDADVAYRETLKSAALNRSSRLTVAGQMAAAIAHEVRNPLHTVRATVQWILDKEQTSADGTTFLRSALQEIDRMNGVLGRLLKFTRPDRDPATACDLREIVEAAVVICTAYAKRQRQRIRSLHAAPLPILASPDELHQIVVNLLLNSLQASDPASEVVVETEPAVDNEGRWAVLRVTDQGTGIPLAIQARILEPFFSTKHDGGGLGLWICRDTVERHGGRLLIESEAGQGTCVTVRLPGQGLDGESPAR